MSNPHPNIDIIGERRAHHHLCGLTTTIMTSLPKMNKEARQSIRISSKALRLRHNFLPEFVSAE